jgi:hypothetical protein
LDSDFADIAQVVEYMLAYGIKAVGCRVNESWQIVNLPFDHFVQTQLPGDASLTAEGGKIKVDIA